MLTLFWNLKDIQNSRQNRSKNKLVRENAVTRTHGCCTLQIMGSWSLPINTNFHRKKNGVDCAPLGSTPKSSNVKERDFRLYLVKAHCMLRGNNFIQTRSQSLSTSRFLRVWEDERSWKGGCLIHVFIILAA